MINARIILLLLIVLSTLTFFCASFFHHWNNITTKKKKCYEYKMIMENSKRACCLYVHNISSHRSFFKLSSISCSLNFWHRRVFTLLWQTKVLTKRFHFDFTNNISRQQLSMKINIILVHIQKYTTYKYSYFCIILLKHSSVKFLGIVYYIFTHFSSSVVYSTAFASAWQTHSYFIYTEVDPLYFLSSFIFAFGLKYIWIHELQPITLSHYIIHISTYILFYIYTNILFLLYISHLSFVYIRPIYINIYTMNKL